MDFLLFLAFFWYSLWNIWHYKGYIYRVVLSKSVGILETPLPVLMVCEWPPPYISWHLGQYCRYDLRNNDTGGCDGLHAFLGPDNRRSIQCHYYYFNRPLCRLFSPYRTCFPVRSRCYYISTLDVFFCQITTFIKVCVEFVFGLQTL